MIEAVGAREATLRQPAGRRKVALASLLSPGGLAATLALAPRAYAQPCYDDGHGGEVCVPGGDDAFAQSVLEYVPGDQNLGQCDPNDQGGTASAALGPPDSGPDHDSDTSLGVGGSLSLEFIIPLTGSGDDGPDVWVWEVGLAAEDDTVEVSADGASWTLVGQSDGSTFGSQGFDIDAHGFDQTSRLFFVRVTDVGDNLGCPAGSDIDAVAVLSNIVPGIELTKSADPSTGVAAGDEVTYSFSVFNSGTDTLLNVAVTDPLEGLSAVECPQTSLAPGATVICTATYTVTAEDVAAGSIENTATVSADPEQGGDAVTAEASAVVETAESPTEGADLSITKTATVSGDASVVFALTVANGGPADATGVVVTDELPRCTTHVSDDCGGDAGPPFGWTIGDLANGGSASCNITVDASKCDGVQANSATVEGNEDDPNGGNNADEAEFEIEGVPAMPLLASLMLLALLATVALWTLRRAQA